MAVANCRVTCGNDVTVVTAAPPLAVRQPDLRPLSVAWVPVLWWYVERGAAPSACSGITRRLGPPAHRASGPKNLRVISTRAPSRRGGGTGGQGGVAQLGRKGGGGSIPAGSGPTGDCRTRRPRPPGRADDRRA